MVLDHFDDSGPAEALERLRAGVLTATLRLVQGEAHRLPHLTREAAKILKGRCYPYELPEKTSLHDCSIPDVE